VDAGLIALASSVGPYGGMRKHVVSCKHIIRQSDYGRSPGQILYTYVLYDPASICLYYHVIALIHE